MTCYSSARKALRKKSAAPKLPDFKASNTGLGPVVAVHGTPGSICGPIRKASVSSACTTAPDVSPPATMSCVTPANRVQPSAAGELLQRILPDDFEQRYARFARLGFPLVIFLIVILPLLAPNANIVAAIVIPPVQSILQLLGLRFG